MRITTTRRIPRSHISGAGSATDTYVDLAGASAQQVIREECTAPASLVSSSGSATAPQASWVTANPAQLHTGSVSAQRNSERGRRPANGYGSPKGEKDADTLSALGRLATTNAQGATNFPAELVDVFTGSTSPSWPTETSRDISGRSTSMASARQHRPGRAAAACR